MAPKNMGNKLSIDPQKFFDGILKRMMRGKLKLRVYVAKSLIRFGFLAYRTTTKFSLLLRRREYLSDRICKNVQIYKNAVFVECCLLGLMVTFSSLLCCFP